MPLAIVEALISIAIGWGWLRFAAVLGIIFFGITRPGEALKEVRRLLVLPRDLLQEDLGLCYFQVSEPKSRRRGRGRLQHATIKHADLVAFLDFVYGAADPDTPLFPASSSSFRRRWDRALLALGVPKKVGLTPGGLRGGGAVNAFREGETLPSLLWRMRLRHLSTLESYLQEVTASTVIPQLSSCSRRSISAASACCRPLLLSVVLSGLT